MRHPAAHDETLQPILGNSSRINPLRASGRAFAQIAQFHPELTAFRRDLHAHPELGFEEVYTSSRVAHALKLCGVDEVHTGIGKTGVVAVIKGQQTNPTTGCGVRPMVGLRADMDALPMTEHNEFGWKSSKVGGGYQSEEAPVVATTVGKPALQNTLLSVAYDFGVAKVGAGFNRAKYKDVFIAPGRELAAQKEFSLSVAVPLGATTISAGYAQSKGDDLGKSTGYGVQALYSLSKRTTLYTGVASSKTYDNLAALTAQNAPGSNIGRNTQYALGVRHTF